MKGLFGNYMQVDIDHIIGATDGFDWEAVFNNYDVHKKSVMT